MLPEWWLSNSGQVAQWEPEYSYIVADSDKITAATMYRLYGDAKRECSTDSRLKAEAVFEELIVQSNEAESITAHPFIKFQKARILQFIDRSKILEEVHTNEIKKSFQKAIFTVHDLLS